MRHLLVLIGFGVFTNWAWTQNRDSTKIKCNVAGYADIYYGYHFNKPRFSSAPYGVFAMQHNEFALNLAYIKFSGQSKKIRFSIAPGVGTYMSANYAAEPRALRNVYEAFAGVQLSSKRKIWVDMGVLPSPYTNETAENIDHLTYSRSLGSEYSPYYLSGIRVVAPLSNSWTLGIWGLSGWQTIVNQGRKPALGLNLSGMKENDWTVGVSAFLGNVQTPSLPFYKMRYFMESNAAKILGKNEIRMCISSGLQQFSDTTLGNSFWYAGNIQVKHNFNHQHSAAFRMDAYKDKSSVIIQNITGNAVFSNVNFTLNYTLKLRPEMFFRFEGRQYFSQNNSFIDNMGIPVRRSSQLIAAFTMKI